MSILPSHLLYTDTHLWAWRDGEGYVTLGLTDFAQETLGDVIEVFLPPEGSEVSQATPLMSLAAERNHFEVYSPLSGEVVEVNEALLDSPLLINHEPYDEGWLVKIAPIDEGEMDDFLSDEDYAHLVDYA